MHTRLELVTRGQCQCFDAVEELMAMLRQLIKVEDCVCVLVNGFEVASLVVSKGIVLTIVGDGEEIRTSRSVVPYKRIEREILGDKPAF